MPVSGHALSRLVRGRLTKHLVAPSLVWNATILAHRFGDCFHIRNQLVFGERSGLRRAGEPELISEHRKKRRVAGLQLVAVAGDPNMRAVSRTDIDDREVKTMKFAGLVALSTIGVIVLGVSSPRAAPIIADAIGGGAYANSLITRTRAMPHCGIDPRHHRHCQPLRKPASKT